MKTRIIEINGVKMEVDLREAKTIESYKVGDSVKILIKDGYGSEYKSYVGIIIGFDDFKETPTIVIAYLKTSYSDSTIDYCYFNSKIKDVELCPLNDYDIPFTKQQVLDEFDKTIHSHQVIIDDTIEKKKMFIKLFQKYFDKVETLTEE